MDGLKKFLRSIFHSNAYTADISDNEKECLVRIKEIISNYRSIYDPSLLLKEIEFVIFDTETTGFHAYAGDKVISIGAVKIKNGKTTDRFHQLINPKRQIPMEIEGLTGISNRDVENKPSILEGLCSFLIFAEQHFLVAYYADFDIHFLNLPLQKLASIQIPFPILDIMMLSYHLNPNIPSQKLDVLLKKYHIEIIGRHNALEDAIMTAKLFNEFIMQLEEERGITRIGGLKNSMPSICRQNKPYIFKKADIHSIYNK